MALTPSVELIGGLRSRMARVAVTASTLRSLPPGTGPIARSFLRSLPLEPFGTHDGSKIEEALNRATSEFVRSLPVKARHWGVARKFLNLFVRECTYNAHLRSAFQLGPAERHLELPLDGVVAEELRHRFVDLPEWTSLSALTPETSAIYQKVAAELAQERRTRRVHLDVALWSESRD